MSTQLVLQLGTVARADSWYFELADAIRAVNENLLVDASSSSSSSSSSSPSPRQLPGRGGRGGDGGGNADGVSAHGTSVGTTAPSPSTLLQLLEALGLKQYLLPLKKVGLGSLDSLAALDDEERRSQLLAAGIQKVGCRCHCAPRSAYPVSWARVAGCH
jgi:hypothetical protein